MLFALSLYSLTYLWSQDLNDTFSRLIFLGQVKIFLTGKDIDFIAFGYAALSEFPEVDQGDFEALPTPPAY
jgi:hypothetical protein